MVYSIFTEFIQGYDANSYAKHDVLSRSFFIVFEITAKYLVEPRKCESSRHHYLYWQEVLEAESLCMYSVIFMDMECYYTLGNHEH